MGNTAREVMQTQVVTVSSEAPLSAVRQLFVDEGIHGAPVVDDRMQVLGVISTTDLLRAASEAHESARPEPGYDTESTDFYTLADIDETFAERLSEARTVDYMTDGAVSVGPDTSIQDLARTFRQHGVHRVLVVEGGTLLGLVSTLDLIAVLEQVPPEAIEKALTAAR